MKSVIRILAIGSCLLPAVSLGAEETRPNILFIAIDDMNDWTGFLGGHAQAVTPNLDAVARRGVSFTNAHCPAPGCSPSRNALLYGIEPFNSGLYAFYDKEDIHADLREKYTSLPQLLQANGYETFGAGKIHHGSWSPSVEWTGYHEPQKFRLKLDVEKGYQVDGQFKMSFCPTTNPDAEHPDYQVASYGVDILKAKHDKPFFLAVGIVKPHLPFVCPERFFDLYPDPVDPPCIKEDDLDDIPWVGRAMAKVNEDKRYRKDEAWARIRRAYLACISWADFNIGRVLDALEASPYAGNTIVVIWSDHGFALGEKHHFRKFALWEETTRVPFIILDTREKEPPMGRTVEEGVSLINIYKTLAELTGLNAPDYVDGFSLVPQLKEPSTPVPELPVCSWGRGNYTVRDKDFRYIRYFDGGEELYAHTRDPDEWTNLADDPAYAADKARLAAFLPKTEAPLVTEGVAPWSIPVSADNPGKGKKL